MDLSQVMQKKCFAVAGDTLNPEKYAYLIKHAMLQADYRVACVGKELACLAELPEDTQVLDLCIHPAKGLALLKQCDRRFDAVVIQPGAESEELMAYLDEIEQPYLQGCLLVGLREYPPFNN